MQSVSLVWVSNSIEWEDVCLEARRVVYDGDVLRISYLGQTEDEGHYEGEFELALREGLQGLEGEYTVYPPKGADEQFAQVVPFGLTGQIKLQSEGHYAFAGIWDESGIAHEFRVGPLEMTDSPPKPVAVSKAESTDVLSQFESSLAAYQLLLPGAKGLASFQPRFDQLTALVAAVRQRQSNNAVSAQSLSDYLREEASLALETLLDEPVVLPGGTSADLRRVADNMTEALRQYGYPVCANWLGVSE
ncbi:hypothetical protein [Chitinimonas sp. BJB300]|uniref:hypothetical protein n=1 Tax=Chitinimonas sp. BJB300 TaxID=1559339 RepID=UPI000C0FC726|nr:hypothetical protein [Chitinimonas sp. BJB300]PHV11353.1 hypothetical protein CSQ89_11320 [Chitinimonas sp. BJB300]TSJ87473.1 hypothetical protein FG002_013105 [Chitinimonas sp. BJB300]